MANAIRRDGTITGRTVLLAFCAFFGTIIAVNAIMAVMAFDTHTGLVAKNGYVASQDFNRMNADARAQEALGWRMTAAADRQGVTLSLTGADGAPLRGMSVTALVGRPVTEREDRTLTFAGRGGGRYAAAADLAPGVWSVDAVAQDAGGRRYRRVFRLTVAAGDGS
jgi:nitrogen fixation protein FixH